MLKDIAHYLFLLTPFLLTSAVGLIAYLGVSRKRKRSELVLYRDGDRIKIEGDPATRVRMSKELARIFGGERMDPITILTVLASIIEIANFVERSAGGTASADAIERVFNERAADPSTPEARLKSKITAAQLRTEIDQILLLRVTAKDFLDRIDQKCLPPYKAVVNDPDAPNSDVDEAYEVARKCICENIRFARRQHGGKFPNDAMRKLWEEYNCS